MARAHESSRAPDVLGGGRFVIARRIGSGAAGTVFEAFDREQNAKVAVKVLSLRDPESVLRFKNEFRAIQEVHHENLVTLGELFEEDGRWFFWMDFVEGTDLLSHFTAARAASDEATLDAPIRLDGPQSGVDLRVAATVAVREERIRRAMSQVARGLIAIHDAGKVHRDIKPSNILVTPSGVVKIVDYGLLLDVAHAEAGEYVGTAAYMAPEQAAGDAVGPAADWYAFGVVLYRALTGSLPFTGEVADVMLAKQCGEPRRPHEAAVGMEALCDLSVELLRIDLARRPTGAQVLAALGGNDASVTAMRTGTGTSADRSLTRGRLGAAPGTRFVGREAELAELDAAFEARPSTVMVEGESGVGKSALVRTFAERANADRGALVLAGRCYEREAVPFKAFDGIMDALSEWLGRLPTEEVEKLLPANASLVPSVFPTLRRVHAVAASIAAEPVADPTELRARVFDAIRAILVAISETRPLVLVVDDIQWTDADSVALFEHVLKPPDAPALMLLATHREVSRTRPSSPPPRKLPGDVRHLQVRRLEPERARELAALLIAAHGAGASVDAEAIARGAAGHPLFIDELVRHRMTSGEAVPHAGLLEDALRARVETLDSPTRHIVELAAVAGRPLRAEIAAQAAAMDFADFAKRLAIVRAANLVRSTGARRSDRIETYHDRVRESVIATLDPATVRLWHGRLALSLEAAERADPEELAAHWSGAGKPDRAAKYAEAAAVRAAESLAFDRAVRLFRLAIELSSPDSGQTRALHVKLGHALAHAGRGSEAAESWLAGVPGAMAAEALELQRLACDQYLISGHHEAGLATMERVLLDVGMTLPSTPTRALALLLLRRAHVRLRGLGFRPRDTSQIAAHELARIDVCWSVARGLGMIDTIRGAEFQSRHLLLALAAGEPFRVLRALGLEVGYSASGGTKTSARTNAIRALLDSVSIRFPHDPRVVAWLSLIGGAHAQLEGRWRDAAEQCSDAAAFLRSRCVNVAWEIDTMNAYGNGARVMMGELRAVRRTLASLIDDAERRGDIYVMVHLKSGIMATVHMAAGAVDDAVRLADEALRASGGRALSLPCFFDLQARTDIDLYVGEPRRAYDRIAAMWRPLHLSLLTQAQYVRGHVHQMRGRAALATAERADGASERASLLRDAARCARRLESEAPWTRGLGQLIRAGVEALRGDHARARRALEDAAASCEAADMAMHAAAARRILGGEAAPASRAWFEREAVVDADRLTALVVPGFAARRLEGGPSRALPATREDASGS